MTRPEDAAFEAAVEAAAASIPPPGPEQAARLRALLPPVPLAPDGEAVA